FILASATLTVYIEQTLNLMAGIASVRPTVPTT
ncbi:unnamed protein product, partial [marine sediment metagenome]